MLLGCMLQRQVDALQFGREPNQIISVLSSFSCSRRDAHHLANSETQLRRSWSGGLATSTSEMLYIVESCVVCVHVTMDKFSCG